MSSAGTTYATTQHFVWFSGVRVDGTGPQGATGAGVPTGGTANQILTKTSATDYATAWQTPTVPILANNVALRGYKADGTTPQNLIGMTTADEVSIAPSLAAGKQIYVPRLTVQGPLTLADSEWVQSAAGAQVVTATGAGAIYFSHNRDAAFNADAGRTIFMRDVNVVGVLYKGSTAYTHPDHTLELWATGKIERFREAHGAATYQGRLPFDALEHHLRTHWRLPGSRTEGRYDLFERGETLLIALEEAYLYIVDLHHRVRTLEENR
jgi:hypothetical protein